MVFICMYTLHVFSILASGLFGVFQHVHLIIDAHGTNVSIGVRLLSRETLL